MQSTALRPRYWATLDSNTTQNKKCLTDNNFSRISNEEYISLNKNSWGRLCIKSLSNQN